MSLESFAKAFKGAGFLGTPSSSTPKASSNIPTRVVTFKPAPTSVSATPTVSRPETVPTWKEAPAGAAVTVPTAKVESVPTWKEAPAGAAITVPVPQPLSVSTWQEMPAGRAVTVPVAQPLSVPTWKEAPAGAVVKVPTSKPESLTEWVEAPKGAAITVPVPQPESISVWKEAPKGAAVIPESLFGPSTAKTELKLGTLGVKSTEKPLYPKTNEEMIAFLRDKLYSMDLKGINDADKEKILNYFPFAVPAIMQKVVDADDVVKLINRYESLKSGVTADIPLYSDLTGERISGEITPPFKDLTLDKQKRAIEDFYVRAMADEVPPAYALSLISALIESEPSEVSRRNLTSYIKTGELEKDVNDITHGDIGSKTVIRAKSPEALAGIGATFGTVGAIGATLAAGPAAGVAAAGLIPFATTEFVNYFSMSPFRTKAELQALGEYAPDKKVAFDQSVSSVSDVLDQLTFQGKDLSPSERTALIGEAERAVTDLEKQLGEYFPYLYSLGVYDSEMRRVENLRNTLSHQKSMFTPSGDIVPGASDIPAHVTIKPPKGGYIKGSIAGAPFSAGTDATFDRDLPGSGLLSYVIYDKEGNIVDTGEQKYWPNSNPIYLDYSVSKAWKPSASTSPTVKSTKYTISVPSGFTLRIGDKSYEGGKSYDVVVKEGEKQTAVIEKPGYRTDTFTMYATNQGWVGYTPTVVVDPYYKTPEQKAAERAEATKVTKYTINVPEGSTMRIGNVTYSGGKSYDVTVKEGEKQTAIIEKPGFKADTFTMYATDQGWVGYTPTLAVDPYFKTPEQVAAERAAAVKTTKYTITVPEGSTLRIGDTTYAGGKSYDITVKEGEKVTASIEKPGFKTDTFTMYAVDQGWVGYKPTMIADPYYKPPGYTPTGKLVLETSPDATVTVNGEHFSTALGDKEIELAPGYYSVTITKPGYEPFTRNVYVGEDQSVVLSDPAYPAEEEERGGGGGGGGGGASYGGGGGGSTAIDYGLIIYGPTCTGARIWQDEVEVFPEIGTTYSISPGYHSIRIEREGKKPWIKSVFIIAGDTLTISPAFEDLPSTGGTTTPTTELTPETTATKRVYINSDPSGAKILLNGYATGQWTPGYLDLPYGYYVVSFSKSGYAEQHVALYVGDTILWGDSATTRAQSEGLI